MNYEALDEALEYIEAVNEAKNWSPEEKKRLDVVCDFLEKMWEKHKSMMEGYESNFRIKSSFCQPTTPEKIRKKVYNSPRGYKTFGIGAYGTQTYAQEMAKYAQTLPLLKKYEYRVTIIANTTTYTVYGFGGGTTTYSLRFQMKKQV